MDDYNESTEIAKNEEVGFEEYPLLDPLDTWNLEDFEDVFE